MSINIPSKEATRKSPCCKKSINEEDPVRPNIRKYNVKKSDRDEYDINQSNKWYEHRYDPNHRSRPSMISGDTDMKSKYRYKSYDYLPLKYSALDHRQYRQNREMERCRECSISPNNSEYYDNERRRSMRSFEPRSSGIHSSTEEVDYSHYSSDNSRKYSYRSSNQNYGETKYSTGLRDYEDVGNAPSRKSYNTRRCYKDTPQRLKHASFSKPYDSYANNNRSDKIAKHSYSPMWRSEDNYSRRMESRGENFSRFDDDMYNRNSGSLKSTYRKDENIPHSGTALESNRKPAYRRPSGSFRCSHSRYNESNNCERVGGGDSRLVAETKKLNLATVQQSPKCAIPRNPLIAERNTVGCQRNIASTSRHFHRHTKDPHSDNESGCFESCRNSNNEYVSKPPLHQKKQRKCGCETVYLSESSSSQLMPNVKEKDEAPVPFQALKGSTNVKAFDPPLSEDSNRNVNYSAKENVNPPFDKSRDKCSSVRHRSNRRRH